MSSPEPFRLPTLQTTTVHGSLMSLEWLVEDATDAGDEALSKRSRRENPRKGTARSGKLSPEISNDGLLEKDPSAPLIGEMVLAILFAFSVNIHLRGDPKHHRMVSPSKN